MLSRILSYLFVCLPIITDALIVQTATVQDVLPLVDHNTWIVIDLDNTAFEGKQALGHTDWFYDKAYALMRGGMSLEEATRECYPEWIEVQKICPVKPVEEAFIPVLTQMQQQDIVVMALTHRQPSIADSTLRQLESLQLNLHNSAPFQDILVVPSSTPTLYKDGVLFTGEYNKKGEIFVRFLSIIGQKPQKVLFIDDKRGHVEDVEKALTSQGIDYTGVHYTANEKVEKVYSPHLAEVQRKYMHTILSNEAAALLIEHGLD